MAQIAIGFGFLAERTSDVSRAQRFAVVGYRLSVIRCQCGLADDAQTTENRQPTTRRAPTPRVFSSAEGWQLCRSATPAALIVGATAALADGDAQPRPLRDDVRKAKVDVATSFGKLREEPRKRTARLRIRGNHHLIVSVRPDVHRIPRVGIVVKVDDDRAGIVCELVRELFLHTAIVGRGVVTARAALDRTFAGTSRQRVFHHARRRNDNTTGASVASSDSLLDETATTGSCKRDPRSYQARILRGVTSTNTLAPPIATRQR